MQQQFQVDRMPACSALSIRWPETQIWRNLTACRQNMPSCEVWSARETVMRRRTTMDVNGPTAAPLEHLPVKFGTNSPFGVVNRRTFLSMQLAVYLSLSIGGLIQEDLFAWDDCTSWDDALSWA